MLVRMKFVGAENPKVHYLIPRILPMSLRYCSTVGPLAYPLTVYSMNPFEVRQEVGLQTGPPRYRGSHQKRMFSTLHRVLSSLLGPADLSFLALSGRLKFAVRRHKFNTDSLSYIQVINPRGTFSSQLSKDVWSFLVRTVDPPSLERQARTPSLCLRLFSFICICIHTYIYVCIYTLRRSVFAPQTT